MRNPADVAVLIFSANANFGATMRTALRGMGVRAVQLAHDEGQVISGFALIDPQAVIVYVDDGASDPGLAMLRFLRRSPQSPKTQIPIIVASQSRDIKTISAAINLGAHEYVLFPASGDQLLKKITSAHTSTRPFIEAAGYVGPCRRRRADPSWTGPERRAAVVAAAK
jgi:DNA-binding NarL/FixJ family response regulator